jgi:putative isomerase
MTHAERILGFLEARFLDAINPPVGELRRPFINAGGEQYANALWDWDSWISNLALRQAVVRFGVDDEIRSRLEEAERGCILNFLDHSRMTGFVPVEILPYGPAWRINHDPGALPPTDTELLGQNPHKPCLAQHAAFIVECQGGDAGWLAERFAAIQLFLAYYKSHCRHACGLYFFQNDVKIGVDNDPCTFGRPPRSSGSVYLNSLLHREFLAAALLAKQFGLEGVATEFAADAARLAAAIQEHCWDERDGFFYSVDFNLEPLGAMSEQWRFHSGRPRSWPCLIQRIGVWSGLLPVWSGVATADQARRVIEENLSDPRTFSAPFGIRSLSALEKMYSTAATSNPGSWLGPIWNIVNYFAFRAAVLHGFDDFAGDLCDRTVRLLGKDLERSGTFHEYYEPDTGAPVMTPDFRDWNGLVLNMLTWREGGDAVCEF